MAQLNAGQSVAATATRLDEAFRHNLLNFRFILKNGGLDYTSLTLDHALPVTARVGIPPPRNPQGST